ncbi:MAG: hypothetical protein Q4C86_14705, partial [bacterium]|nr:hypothetical protein [bacterium]
TLRASSDVTTSRIAQIRKTLIWLPGRLAREALKAQTKIAEYRQVVFVTITLNPNLSFTQSKINRRYALA